MFWAIVAAVAVAALAFVVGAVIGYRNGVSSAIYAVAELVEAQGLLEEMDAEDMGWN